MKPSHHPSDDILAAYVGGALEAGFGLVAGAHIEACAHCRERVARLEAASGAALEALPNAALAPDALAQAMSRLDTPNSPPDAADNRPLLERLPLKRKKWLAPGVWVAAVDTPHAPDNRIYVLHVAPGGATARHEHDGAEFCMVLKGAYRDELGVFAAGDFASAEHDLNHQPIVVGKEPCVCLFATEGRLRAKGVIGQLAFRYANV
ncbi:MAG: ChrR family anti-sigma-E factor [Terricaulis sp.]